MARRWLFRLRNLSRNLSARAALSCVLAFVSALIAVMFDEYVPDDFADLAGGDAIDGILTMMTSSMLIVVTFTLSSIVTSYSSATQNATPRATKLIRDDSSNYGAISTFLGAFIYNVVSLIALSTGYYGEKGRVILLCITVLVLTLVVWVIIQWVDDLKNMGSVTATIMRVEKATTCALSERAKNPTFNCGKLVKIPEGARVICAREIGFLQNIDVEYLGKYAQKHSLRIYVANSIGTFVHYKSPLVHVDCLALPEDCEKTILRSFAVGYDRTFSSDPVYGVSVLSGVGLKALSPSLIDPGTALDVVASLVRVIMKWESEKNSAPVCEPKYAGVFFPELEVRDIFYEAFDGLMRQSLSSPTVLKALREAFLILGDLDDKEISEHARAQERLLTQRTLEE